MRKIIISFIFLLLIGILLISSYFIYTSFLEDNKQEKIFKNLIAITENENEKENVEIKNENINISELYSINNDLVGWLKIENSNINFPIMQTKEKPNYYLRKNFYKEYSYSGTPYLAEHCDIENNNNLIIYGHNLNGKKMFGELENYKNQEYYKNHKIIKFYTLNGMEEYEIIAVFKTIAYTGFKYYNFTNFNNEKEFNVFYEKCKELSFYNIEIEANYDDKFITLSTCEYSNENGRFVVVARTNV